MKAALYFPLEVVMVIVVMVIVIPHPGWVDWLVGMPPPDELLCVSACSGDGELFDKALRDGAAASAMSAIGDTPLACAVRAGEVKMAHRLIHRGADVNQGVKVNGTPLMAAAYNGDIEMIQLLLDHGADPQLRRGDAGPTALDIAVMEGADGAAYLLSSWTRAAHPY